MKVLSIVVAAFATLATVALASPITVSTKSDAAVVNPKHTKPSSVPATHHPKTVNRGYSYSSVVSGKGNWAGRPATVITAVNEATQLFRREWDQNHRLYGKNWMWFGTVKLTNGGSIRITASVQNGYVLSADDVAEYVHQAVQAMLNKYSGLTLGIYNTGDNGSTMWGYVTITEVTA